MDAKSIGQQIKVARFEKNLSQRELGRLISVSDVQIGRYESGESETTALTLYQIAVALEKPIDFFFNNQTVYNPKIKNKMDELSFHIASSLKSLEEMKKYFSFQNSTINSKEITRQRVPKKQFRTTRTINGINIEVMNDNHGEIVYVDGREKEKVK